MPYISARAIYLVVTFLIIILFGATGAYYYLDLKKNASIANKVSTPQQYIQDIQPEITPEPTISTQLSACQQTCQFNFHCQGNMECMDIGGAKICVNPDCPNINTCMCSSDLQASPSGQYINEPAPTTTPKLTPIPTPLKVTPKPSIKPKGTPIATASALYDPQLPDAGLPFVSVIMLLIAILATTTGLIQLRRKSIS